jgi:predicted nucleic acid-binding Zn ribbon protein
VQRLGDDLARELSRFGGDRLVDLTRIVDAWPGTVGETIARNAWPSRLARDGTLHVATTSSAWAFELAHLQGDLLVRLRRVLDDATPKGLRFAVGPVPEPGRDHAAASAPQPPPDPGPEHRAQAALIAAAVEDVELRELVAKAAAASLSRAVSDRRF